MSHDHDIVDVDTYFGINAVTKAITTTAEKTVLVQGTHNSERFTFQIPRVIEGHDMSQSDRIEVHFTNYSADKRQSNGDVYLVNDVDVKGDVVVFSWLVSRNATSIVGTLQFTVNFICVDADDYVIYEWPTDIFKGIRVVERINNTASVIGEYPDLIAGLIGGGSGGNVITKDVVAVSNVKDGNTVTSTVTYEDGTTSVSVITLDVDGNPVKTVTNGVTCTFTWEGFDE